MKPLKIHYTLHPFLYHNQKLIHQKMMIMKSFKHKLTYFSQGDLDEFDGTEPFLSISENIQELHPDYIRLVSKIIAICSFFSRSSVSQDQLEIICTEKNIKVLKIKTDVCTKWSSLHQMLSIFLKMYPTIKEC